MQIHEGFYVDHRMVGILRSGGTSGGHSVQPITKSRDSCDIRVGCFGLFQSSLVLKMCKDEDRTTSLGNLIHCLTALMVEEHVPLSSLNHYCFNLCPLSLILLACNIVKSLLPSSWWPACRYCKAAIRCPPAPSLLFSRLNKIHSLSLPSQHPDCSGETVELVPVYQCISRTSGPQTGHNIQGPV